MFIVLNFNRIEQYFSSKFVKIPRGGGLNIQLLFFRHASNRVIQSSPKTSSTRKWKIKALYWIHYSMMYVFASITEVFVIR
jgi:hypothetical protein